MVGLINKIRLTLRTYCYARSIIGRQFKSDKLTEIQNEKLQKLIHYSLNNIKYYREIFKHKGIRPDQIRTIADLHKIPFLTKQQLRERFWDFLPHELPVSRVSRTSGSTGAPICILSDINSRMFNSAAVIRYRKALGIKFLGGPILTPLKTSNEPIKKNAHWTFLQGIHKTYYINPYIESQENIKYVERLLSKLKKPALIGITSAIRALAYRIQDGIYPPFQPSVILTTGESLSPMVRSLLETAFNAKVADIYACNEAGDIAWQCLNGTGYHINADNIILEIVKDDQPITNGQVGEVVITNLNRYAMPIIRYKNGDLARLTYETCSCGCKLPMIAEVVGRTGEDIFLSDGKIIPWNQLKSPMNHPQIRQFQLIQNENGSLVVKYVLEVGADGRKIENLLLLRYRDILGSSICIEMKRTDKISSAASGKSKLVISNYRHNVT